MSIQTSNETQEINTTSKSSLDETVGSTVQDEDDDIEDQETFKDPEDLEDLDDFSDVQLACSDETLDQMSEITKTQSDLNKEFIGEDWLVRATQHTDIDYCPAVLDEATELMRSCLRWKFWKQPEAEDLTNMRLEFIDIMHFVVSEAMASKFSSKNLEKNMGFWYEQVYNSADLNPHYDYLGMKKALFALLSSVFSVHAGNLDGSDLLTDISSFADSSDSAGIDWEAFWSLSFNLGMTYERVYLTYMAKVQLNRFRIKVGYRSGNYKKVWWAGQEDNFWLMAMVEKEVEKSEAGEDLLPAEEVFNWIEAAYSSFTEGGLPPGLGVAT